MRMEFSLSHVVDRKLKRGCDAKIHRGVKGKGVRVTSSTQRKEKRIVEGSFFSTFHWRTHHLHRLMRVHVSFINSNMANWDVKIGRHTDRWYFRFFFQPAVRVDRNSSWDFLPKTLLSAGCYSLCHLTHMRLKKKN